MEKFEHKFSQNVFFQYVTYKSSNDLAVIEYGFEDFTKSHEKIKPRVRDDYILHYVMSGQGNAIIDNTTYQLKKGEFFLIPPNVEAYYYPNEDDPWKYCWVVFNGLKAQFFCSRAQFSLKKPTYDCKNSEKIIGTMNILFESSDISTSIDMHALSTLYKILALIIDERVKLIIKENNKERIIKKIIEYIEANYPNSTLKIENISQFIHISHSYMCKIFKDIMGITVNKYLTNIRLQKASNLLATTDKSIKDISYNVGFIDQLYFSRLFKNKFGIAPSRYKTSTN